MPTTYPLDLTGVSALNLITNEIHTFDIAADRIFPLNAGPFYTAGLTVRHGVTNALLAPITQYTVLHMHRAGSLVSGKEVCAVIIVEDAVIPSVRVSYQCIGGIYSSEATLIRDLIDNNPLPPGPVTWGQLIGVPVQFPPTEHLHHLDNIYGAEEIVAVLERLRIAVAAGDSPAIAAIYAHIHTLLANSTYMTEQQVIDLIAATALPWQFKADINGDPAHAFSLYSYPIGTIQPSHGINAAFLATQFATLWTRLTANGVDADLAVTNNATGLDLNIIQFRTTGVWYFDEAINAPMLNVAGILIARKAGTKIYQHVILETGLEGNRVYNGTVWSPWSIQGGSVDPSLPVSSYGDLNTYTTAGTFSFKTSDNLGHAPPSQGIESDFTLQVLVTPMSGVIQIAKNLMTNTGFVRQSNPYTNAFDYNAPWTTTAPIDHIVTNTNIANIIAEGTYLCTEHTNYGFPISGNANSVAIIHVKNSGVTQSVVQVQDRRVAGLPVAWRSMANDGVNPSTFSPAEFTFTLSAIEPRIGTFIDNRFGFTDGYERLGVVFDSFQINWALSNYDINKLRHSILNALPHNVFASKAGYYFTLSDNVINTPPALTDTDYFFFLFTCVFSASPLATIGSAQTHFETTFMIQFIYQPYYETVHSAVYVRVMSVSDWLADVVPPDWEML